MAFGTSQNQDRFSCFRNMIEIARNIAVEIICTTVATIKIAEKMHLSHDFKEQSIRFCICMILFKKEIDIITILK